MPTVVGESKRMLVRNYITDMIDSRQLQQGDKLPTEKQLCTRFGVSRITAQNALEELRREGRIYRIQGGGTFVGTAPGDPAPAEAETAPSFIPFIINDNASRVSHLEIINGAEDYLKSRSCYVTVHSPNGDRSEENEIIRSLIRKGVRSMMIFPFQSDVNSRFYFDLIREGIHLVFVDLIPNGLVGNLVCSNNVMGGYLITNHLITQGYRRIAVVGGSTISAPSVQDRITGYRFALEGAGIPVDERYLRLDRSIVTRQDVIANASRILDELLSLPEPPDALFAVNDYTAVDLFYALSQRGLVVPDDVALAGFDNLPVSAENAVPITTVAQDFHGIGYEAAKLCYETDKSDGQAFSHRFLPVRLIERASTRPKKES